MEGMPQFWSCEVRHGEDSLVDVREGEEVVQVTQVSLGGKPVPALGARVVLSVEVDGVTAVVGTLQREVCEQFACDLILPTGCTLRHSGPKGASVHLLGTRNEVDDGRGEYDSGEEYSDSDSDSDDFGDEGLHGYEFSTQSDSSEGDGSEESEESEEEAAQKQLKPPPSRRGGPPSSSSSDEDNDEEKGGEGMDFSSDDDTDALADVASRYMGAGGLYEEMGLLGSGEDDDDDEDGSEGDYSDDDEGVDDFDVDGQDDEGDLSDASLSDSGSGSGSGSESDSESELDTDNDLSGPKRKGRNQSKDGEVVVDGRVMGEVDTDDDEEIDSDDFSDDESMGTSSESSEEDEKEPPKGKRKASAPAAAAARASKSQKVEPATLQKAEKAATPKTRAGKAAMQAKPPSTPVGSSLHDEFQEQIVGMLRSKGKVAFAALGSKVKKPKGTPKVKQFCLARPDIFKVEDDKFVSLA